MKTLTQLIISSCMICFSINTFAQIKVLSNGNVGINYSNPTNKLDIQGSTRWINWTNVTLDWTYECCGSPVLYPSSDWYLQLGKRNQRIGTMWIYTIHYYGGCYKESDFRLKENVKNVSNIRKVLNKLSVVSYNYKAENFGSISDKIKQKVTSNQIGLIAQDVEKIFPSLVDTDDSTGLKGVDYVGFVPLIIQAIKEQDSIITAQADQIKSLQKIVKDGLYHKNTSSKDMFESIENLESASLEQNSPNPFNRTTKIGYFLPNSTQKATLYIYDMSGTLLKTIAINQKGKGSIDINGSELKPGMYLYTLIADGRETDTKRMILTE